jgi:hypothetical protein
MYNISKELSVKIQRTIGEFVADSEPFFVDDEISNEKLNLRKIAAEINVLPIVFDWFACWGIKTDGQIILIDFDQSYKIEIVENQKIINMVLNDTSKKYSELKEIMPNRNPESIICSSCEGTGITKEFSENEFLSKSIRCNCGGVGWLPSSDEKYLYF